MAVDFTVVTDRRTQLGPSNINIGDYVGVQHDLTFDCPDRDASQQALLLFQSYSVAITQVLTVNGTSVFGVPLQMTIGGRTGEPLGSVVDAHTHNLSAVGVTGSVPNHTHFIASADTDPSGTHAHSITGDEIVDIAGDHEHSISGSDSRSAGGHDHAFPASSRTGAPTAGVFDHHTHSLDNSRSGWTGNVLIIQSGVLRETGNVLHVESSGDNFVLDNIVVMYKVGIRRFLARASP